MRLTLRTLLAYLDDVLPPEQAKQLGKKLTESGYATALVDRIKEVMRRRRLTAPELSGPAVGIEPNVVAEYLDNELTPNEIADVERICLESDTHLAEVAACHQILTLVLGEPVDVRAETRQRMYALGPVGRSESLAAGNGANQRSAEQSPIPPIAAALGSSSAEFRLAQQQQLPEYLRPKNSWRRLGVLVLLLISVAWFGLLMRDPTIFGGRGDDQAGNKKIVGNNGNGALTANELAPKSEFDKGVAELNRKLAAAGDQPEKGQLDSKAIAIPTAIAKNDINPKNGDLPLNSRVELPVAEKPMPPAPAENTKPQPVGEEPAVPKKVEEPPLAPRKLLYVSKDDVLLHWDEAIADYLILPWRAELKPDDRLACPEPFRADVTVDADVCQVALIGGTAVRILGPTAQSAFGFDVAQGAVLFESKGLARPVNDGAEKPANPQPQPAGLPIALVMRDRAFRLELLSDDALCGIEVRRRDPSRFEVEPDEPGFSAALHVARGTVRWTADAAEPKTLQGPSFLAITSDLDPNLKTSELGRPSLLVLPDWLEADPKRAAAKSSKRQYNLAFKKEFDPEQALLLSLPAVVNNPRPGISELAVKCLALTDSAQPLVKALATVEHHESRLAAIHGLRHWLPLDARNRATLKADLARLFLPSDADAVYRLLWGFKADDARQIAASRQLVGWLDHEQVAIRELAYFHIQRLTGLKLDYSPINPPAQRRAAVERWYTHLEKRGGKLIVE